MRDLHWLIIRFFSTAKLPRYSSAKTFGNLQLEKTDLWEHTRERNKISSSWFRHYYSQNK
jgi:hypothetical protein